jgi:hypothetical protein
MSFPFQVEKLSDPCALCGGSGRVPLFDHDVCLDCDLFNHFDDDMAQHCECGTELDEEDRCPNLKESTGSENCSIDTGCGGSGKANFRVRVMWPRVYSFEASSESELMEVVSRGLKLQTAEAIALGIQVQRLMMWTS